MVAAATVSRFHEHTMDLQAEAAEAAAAKDGAIGLVEVTFHT